MSKEKKFQLRNQKILTTAEKLLKEKGYYRFKISDISEELEIAKGTIYNHYVSKEDLLFAVIYPKLQHLKDALQKIPHSDLFFKQQLQQAVQIVLESDYHQFLKLTYSDMAVLFQEKNQTEMTTVQEEIIHAFEKILVVGSNEGILREDLSLSFLSHQILLLLDPLLNSLLVDSGKMKKEEFTRQTTELLLYGMTKG
ncbi:TetR/AcrR family transcriptional regulator [Tetragenococcus koreensis]|uniref:TetR/AcrR family transcriptional regulator n=1 Tax=Tetragenococcus koreensis TaxID=290335 RepID=UPI000F4EA492|nr:TetR/AcrR family transcriptional regulator [Tetragenococcus koreensis]AYW45533.1 TetR/AcrR family transcriptional regulator [Tetragenococcus koreensis]MCF1618200.1 TetR/AcrR family transcriptional regulator [Tetragenococcus koreensis]MCF1623039.1 TetR/AcrR family transcriptional regulator [Tetragenococcus koreensis]MCF1679026.1 TetR/AcrR family transcriptional regulator [Tetragenococcus koreensis]MCF1681442.1 TetR/AcrR family transcriptional regulator [Tetragenococcus koreensis]